jgi:hypothetical protein
VTYNPHLSSNDGVDSMYILAFAVVMLNTDLHTPSLKDSRRMKLDEFIKNLCRVEEGKNLDKYDGFFNFYWVIFKKILVLSLRYLILFFESITLSVEI